MRETNARSTGCAVILAGFTFVFVLLPSITGMAAGGQSKAAPATQSSPSIKVQTSLVSAPVTVLDRSGRFVSNLTQKNFAVLDNGVPQHIERFGQATDPVAVVIVIETSQSVGPLLHQVRPLAPLFSKLLLGQKGEAAVLLFDNTVRVAQDFSNSEKKLDQTLSMVTSEGSRARLNDALAQSLQMLRARPRAERRVVVVISEGIDHGSRTRRQEVIERATGSEVTIYGLQFRAIDALRKRQDVAQYPSAAETNMALPTPPGMVHSSSIEQNIYDTPVQAIPIITETGDVISSARARDQLQLYSGYTGGVVYTHKNGSQLQRQLSEVALEINSQYEIAYVPSNLTQKGFHRLQIEVDRPDLKVRARAGYFYRKAGR
jgi:Ca-activated chloride channel family protein